MKFELTFKTPDVIDQLDYLKNEDNVLPVDVTELLKKHILFGEMITIEFDTEAKTVKVLK